jgi:hypothetical protein
MRLFIYFHKTILFIIMLFITLFPIMFTTYYSNILHVVMTHPSVVLNVLELYVLTKYDKRKKNNLPQQITQ